MRNICIVVAGHKPYRMPADPIYRPVQAGRALHPALAGFEGDDTGENISGKNSHYCELTALYWAWKNVQADWLGLVHYRRHFAAPGTKGEKWQRVITGEQLDAFLTRTGAEAVLPKERDYYIETTYNQYVHAHHEQDLTVTRAILAEVYPAYLPAYDAVMARTHGHRFNMLLMRRGRLDSYCTWLFDVLARLEARLDITGYTPYDARVFGFVSERLLDVWVETNQVRTAELPALYMEQQNWLVKGGNFLKRKFFAQKK